MSLLSNVDDTPIEKKEQPKSEKSKKKKDKVIVVPPSLAIETYNFIGNRARYKRADELARYWERLIWGD